jgi:hypothetical protein
MSAIQASDVPTLNQNTTGTAANVTGTVAIANGGTGATSFANAGIAVFNGANTFTVAQTFRAANAIRSEAASTQDAIVIAGRAGGTSSFAAILTPATLTASRTHTLPDVNGTVVTTGDTGTVTNTMLAGSIANAKLANSTISGVALGSNLNTLTMAVSGTGLSGSASYNGSGAATFTVTSNATNANTASTIVARDASGNFSAGTITATLSGNASSATTATTATTANALATGNNYQVNSLGVGTAASGTAGEIRATNNVTAYYSDDRLKTRLGVIENALAKVCALSGFYYQANETAQALGYESVREVGLSAQETQAVLPEIVVPAPIDDKYLTIRYEKMVPLLVEAIKELAAEIQKLK